MREGRIRRRRREGERLKVLGERARSPLNVAIPKKSEAFLSGKETREEKKKIGSAPKR